MGLALGQPQQTSLGYHPLGQPIQTPNLNTYDDWNRQLDCRGVDENLTEEEIRMRSHEMLENEDMQHLLRVLSMGGASVNLPYPLGQPIQTPNLNTYDDWNRQLDCRGVDEYLTEEEIRMRSHEMLENEDMQHLLRVLSMGGASVNLREDGYGFGSYLPSPCPNFNFEEDRSRSSGKAVVGWLKIKAAMRWGIFIRKKAAEKRAELIELED